MDMLVKNMKGIIGLDIDGTVTGDPNKIPQEIIDYLAFLSKEGWQVVFISGRTFSLGLDLLKHFPEVYYFSPQCGVSLIQMPEKKILYRQYFDLTALNVVEEVFKDEPTDFILYGGIEVNDCCYYRPNRFEEDLKKYLQEVYTKLPGKWEAVDSFHNLQLNRFPMAKAFGSQEVLLRIKNKLMSHHLFKAEIVKDTYNTRHRLIQITEKEADKGRPISELKKTSISHPIIAAGDDRNDQAMLREADIKIVMPSAPNEMKEIADIIAPPVEEKGIMNALEKAITSLSA